MAKLVGWVGDNQGSLPTEMKVCISSAGRFHTLDLTRSLR